ncbi:MAG TPA: hypothetical protein VMH86_05945 [Rhizomicrobium sp.]|nr:hypothetical protein [Rhizomicrobium sp.]
MILLAQCGAALAGARDDVLEKLGECARISDDKDRLACYDALSPRVKDALATPPATLDHAPTKDEQKSWFGFDIGSLFGSGTEAKQTTPQQFGQESTPQAKREQSAIETTEVDSITAGVTDYSYNPFGKFIVFLDNGQVWRQQEGESDRAHFSGDPKDNKVTITRGAFGSYNLAINDSHHQFKVVRVK